MNTAAGCALVLAALCNGLGTHLKLIGLWERAAYEAYWKLHCPAGVTTAEPLGVGRRCEAPDLSNPPRISHRLGAEYALRAGPRELWLKRAKDAFVLLVMVVGLVSWPRRRSSAGRALPRPVLILVLAILVAAIRPGAEWDGVALAAGARSFTFLMIALACAGPAATAALSALEPWVARLLWVQIPFVLSQSLLGIPVNGYLPFLHLPRRMAGTFSLPNSLGAFAVIALAFVVVFGPKGRRWPLIVAGVTLIWTAGSATGVMALLWWAFASLYRAAPMRWRRTVLVLSIAGGGLALPALPTLLGRHTVFESVFGPGGRIGSLFDTLETASPVDLLFGCGLGSGTNALASLTQNPSVGSGDSTLTSLGRQTGVLGVAAFYLLLLHAWRRDPPARPFYEVFALVSLVVTLTELFPANVLFGLAVGRSLWHTSSDWPKDENA